MRARMRVESGAGIDGPVSPTTTKNSPIYDADRLKEQNKLQSCSGQKGLGSSITSAILHFINSFFDGINE